MAVALQTDSVTRVTMPQGRPRSNPGEPIGAPCPPGWGL